MNLDNIGSGGLGGIIGGVIALFTDRIAINRRLIKLENKIDTVVSHEICEAIRADTKTHISDMKEDIRYIRARLDEVMSSVQRHREDYRP